MSLFSNMFSLRKRRLTISSPVKKAGKANSEPVTKQRDDFSLPPRLLADPQLLKLYRAIDLAG